MRTPEGFEKDDICKYLVGVCAWFFRTYAAGFGRSGIPDIIACVPIVITADMVGMRVGVFTSIEVKREGKEPTKLQDARMAEIRDSSGFATWGTAEKVIRELKKLPYT